MLKNTNDLLSYRRRRQRRVKKKKKKKPSLKKELGEMEEDLDKGVASSLAEQATKSQKESTSPSSYQVSL